MSERLTRWDGRDENGPRAVLAHDGRFPDVLQEALRKLARYEDEEEKLAAELPRDVKICNGEVTEATLYAIRHYISVTKCDKS